MMPNEVAQLRTMAEMNRRLRRENERLRESLGMETKERKLAFSVDGVHIVIDGNVAYSLAGEIDFRVLTGQDIVSSQTG